MLAFYEHRTRSFDFAQVRNLTFLSHFHRHLELLYVQEGEIDIRIGNCQRLLHKGEAGLCFPHVIHSYQSSQSLNAVMLIFDTDLVPAHKSVLQQSVPEIPVLSAERVHPDIPYLLGRIGEETDIDRTLLEGYLTVLLSRMLPCFTLQKTEQKENLSLPHRLLTYLGEHFTEPLTLTETAKALGVSKYHLSRCLSQKIGCNFQYYLNTLRAQRANSLLNQSELSLTEICFEAGFDSISTFYRAYKSFYGATPGQQKNA